MTLRTTGVLVGTVLCALVVSACSGDRNPTAPTAATVADTATTPPPERVPPDPPPTPPPAPTTVRYRVTFDALWSQRTHPQDYPGNPHFSPLIGTTHHGGVRF